MLNVHIRRSQPSDLDKILEVQATALRKLSITYNSTQVESLVQSQANARSAGDEIGVVAEYEGEIIGFAAIMTSKPSIAGVYVDPKHIRQGVGTQLLEAIEQIGMGRGDKTFDVMSSLATVDFYQARGYQILWKTGFYSEGKHWIRCVNLEKKLTGTPKVNEKQRVDAPNLERERRFGISTQRRSKQFYPAMHVIKTVGAWVFILALAAFLLYVVLTLISRLL
ncbi:GNAT family N-acetyltransferase [Oscillatoria sp. FACHB-1407]|uniref:GNAT family N-acetyltransferase n=1 Tax=Oscillatoria sp. FACHB-1407 TaxID=2692847 RepID=UPI0016852D9C|nr:GNAT family N-acetyltransferase [Oscillatoria sp. FACHB-1407]MBD2462948.1 GNAT family N-acetyltransferase [Oscillatoria sp. FACHB-1407]